MDVFAAAAARPIVAVVSGLLAMGALTACTTLRGDVASQVTDRGDGQRSPESADGQDVSAARVGVGDCLAEPIPRSEEEIRTVRTISCLEPHAEEIYAAVRLAGDEFPGDEVVTVAASLECVEMFEEFVGSPYTESVLEFGFLTPTERSWASGDRLAQCTVYHPVDERLTGSVRNTHDTSLMLRDPATGQVPQETDVDWLKITTGDCVKESSEATEDDYYESLVPCTEPHAEEVYDQFVLGGEEYPGDDEVEELAIAGCISRFEEFVGQAYDDSPLDFSYFTPYEESWRGGDRVVQCRIYDPQGDVTGTLRDTGIQST